MDTSDISTVDLIKHKEELFQNIHELENIIHKLKNEVKDTNSKIFSCCKHEWTIQWADSPGERNYKICSICNLYANEHLNF